MNRAVNLVAFLIGWAACVWGAAEDVALVGPAVVAVLLAAQSFAMPDPLRSIGLVMVVGVIGTAVESALLAAGVYAVSGSLWGQWICPLWVTALWVNFATTIHASLAGLRGRRGLTALVGAVGGPLAYLAAERAGAIRFAMSAPAALGVLAAVWAAVLPLVFWLGDLPPYRPRNAAADVSEVKEEA